MLIKELYLYVLNTSNKDNRGNACTPVMFNNWISFVVIDKFQNYFKQAQAISQQGNAELSDVIMALTDLHRFISTRSINAAKSYIYEEAISVGDTAAPAPVLVLTVGIANYPSDFHYALSLNSNGRPVEIKSPLLLKKYRGGMVVESPDDSPVAFIEDGKIEYLPNDLTRLVLTYLRTPVKPFYDFCMSSADIEIYMEIGTYVKYDSTNTRYNLYSSNGGVLYNDVIHDFFEGLTPNPVVKYSSKTTELDWDETKHKEIANAILEKMGVNLRSPEVAQWAAANQQ